MNENPQKYYHLIGSVESVEQGGIRAKFCILFSLLQPRSINIDYVEAVKSKDTDARVKFMSNTLYYDRDWWIFKVYNIHFTIHTHHQSVVQFIYITERVYCAIYKQELPPNANYSHW